MKKCSKCGIDRPLEQYGTRKNKRGGLYIYAQCKQCQGEYKHKHKEQNLAKYRENSIRYAEEHKEEIAEYKREWGSANKERRAITNRLRYITKRDEILEKSREYRYSEVGAVAAARSSATYYNKPTNKIKIRARDMLNRAMSTGKVIRPGRCTECGMECIPEGHHEDYSRPLDVVWLCKGCHENEHHLNEGR